MQAISSRDQLQIIGDNKRNHRMRRDPDIIRAKAPIESHPPLVADDLFRAVEEALVGELAVGPSALLLQTRLDEVEGQREKGGEEAGDGAGSEGALGVAERGGVFAQLRLGLGEEGQLAEVERHRADHRRVATRPQRRDAFGLGDAHERVDDATVVGALCGRFESVGLHPDQRQVGRVADHGGHAAGGESCGGAFEEADFGAGGFGAGGEGVLEGVEEAETGGCVDGLTQEAGGYAGVEVEEFALGEDVAGYGQRSGLGAGAYTLAGELEAHFDHVDGLDAGGCEHTGETAIDEREGGARVGVVEKVVSGLKGVLDRFFGGSFDFVGGAAGRIFEPGTCWAGHGCCGSKIQIRLTG